MDLLVISSELGFVSSQVAGKVSVENVLWEPGEKFPVLLIGKPESDGKDDLADSAKISLSVEEVRCGANCK